MNREEAINMLYGMRANNLNLDDALEMAIQALEQEPCEMTAEEYRQRMIQAFHNADTDELIAICVLPTEKEFEHLEWLLKNHYKKEPCGDAISRQAVRHILNHEVKMPIKLWKKVFELVDDLPPVTPQPKTGYWITWKEAGNEISSETRFECSVCHDAAQTLCNGLDLLSSFCPNCGARMVEPQESEEEK